MGRVITGALLLVSAFAPLLLILSVLRWCALGWVAWGVVILVGVSLLSLGGALAALRRIQTTPIATHAVRRADERVLSFSSSYIVPVAIALFGQSDAVALAGAGTLVLLLSLIYVRGGLYYLNPTLALIGFRLYEVTQENGSVLMLLARERHLSQRGVVMAHQFHVETYFSARGRSHG